MQYNDGDIFKTNNHWGEIASGGVKRLYVIAYILYKKGNVWVFSESPEKIYKRDIINKIECSETDYKTMWKNAGFRVLNQNTLVSLSNNTDLGEYDSYSEEEDQDDSSMGDFIVKDSESESESKTESESSYVHVSTCDLGCKNGTPGQKTFVSKVMELERRYR